MIKKIFLTLGVLSFSLLSFVYGYDYVTCNNIQLVGFNNSVTGNCLKVNMGDSITISDFIYNFNGGRVTTQFSGTTYYGLYSTGASNNFPQNVRNFYYSGNYYTQAITLNNQNESYYRTGLSCVSEDFNYCMWNTAGFSAIYYKRDLSEFDGLSYDYVILPYSNVNSTRVSTYGFCFHFSDLNKFLCLPARTNTYGLSSIPGATQFNRSDFEYNSYEYFPFLGYTPSGDLTNVMCPTIAQVISNYNMNGFSSGLCYSSSRIFNGSSFVDVDPVSIFDLFLSKDDFISSLDKFATYCESSVYNSNVCAEAFSGEDLRFNLISKIPTDTNVVGGRKSLYAYCNLYNYDPNATTCVASGVNSELGVDYTVDDVMHSIINGNYSVYSPSMSGSVFDNGSGYTFSGDVISNTLNLFGKFTSLFKRQTGNTNGILPTFILIPFIIIVLFKLFKK